MRIKLPPKVSYILDILQANGFEAYAVGGCVRDSILGRNPDDWDITTSALPHEVKRIFPRTVDTGIEHGTVTVLIEEAAFEVTTYRIDGKYEDGRHPKEVAFTRSLEEDLKRRDFTINAMAYRTDTGLVDLFGGMDDLQRKRIRCVGNAHDRFSEDALRILRAIRFSAQLGFSIEEATLEAIRDLAKMLSKISAERICTELTKLITSDHPEYMRVAYESGVTAVILPEFDPMMETPQNNPYHFLNVGEHTLLSMKCISPDRILRFAMLLHDLGKPASRTRDRYGIDHFPKHDEISEIMAVKVMRRLKMDNAAIRRIRILVRHHDWFVRPKEKDVRRMIYEVGPSAVPSLMKVQYADCMAKSEEHRPEGMERISAVWACYQKIMNEEQCISIRQLAVGGRDLIEVGIPEGEQIGRAISMLMDLVLEDQSQNTREALLEYAVALKHQNRLKPEK